MELVLKLLAQSRDRALWCGHHHHHSLKYLVIVYPSGMMVAFGPFNGNTHDSTAARTIRLDHIVSEHCSFDDRSFVIYLDASFALGRGMVTPFRRTQRMTQEQGDWNRCMSTGRIRAEWGIGRVKNQWKMLTNKS